MVIVTVAEDAVHGEFEIVQRSTTGPAPPVCVKVELPLAALLNVPVPPLSIDHAPVPTVGVLPPSPAVVPSAQIVCGPPTVAVVGAATTVTVTLWHAVAVQGDASRRAKYVVVVVGDAMLSGEPVPMDPPVPQPPAYHVIVPP